MPTMPKDHPPGRNRLEARTGPGARTYTPEAVGACQKALRSVLVQIGPWGPRIVLIGGLVPRYLVPEPPAGMEPHIGTTDLDIVVGVSVAADDAAPYRTLARNLRQAGFAPTRESYRWERDVDGVSVALEFFCPPAGPPGRLRRNPAKGIGSPISAISLRGAVLAARDAHEVELEGDTLDSGGVRCVRVRVANLLPFLTLKAFALAERVKDKDAYDIVWTLASFPGGPEGACADASRSPVRRESAVSEAIRQLRDHFAHINGAGPAQYSRFFGQEGDSEGAVRLRRYARGAVRSFLEAWDRL